jgi:signal transduction histidine kinase
MTSSFPPDPRIQQLIQAIEQLSRADFEVDIPVSDDEIGQIGKALQELARSIQVQARRSTILSGLTTQINLGLLLEDVLEQLYLELRDLLPYDRIGLSLISEDEQMVRAVWVKSDLPSVKLGVDYVSPLVGSSLATILETGQPRIINDLRASLKRKPDSTSTRMIVDEGIQSSLTCPLIADGKPIGFIFFSSAQPNTYEDAHAEIYQQLAGQLAVIVERSRMISELTQQNEAIEVQNLALNQLNELKTTLLGMAAHDLRHPLGYIELANNLIAEELKRSTGADLNELVAGISKQTRHGLGLLDELLDVTHLDSNGFSLYLETIDLAPFLAEVVKQQSRIAAMKGTRIVLTECPEGQVEVDPQRLHQIIDNLISNAIKYSPPGSEVKISAKANSFRWLISVEDEGPGIKPEDRLQLFQDFAKLSAKPTGGERSTGLGLAIARRVVEAHGGHIGVDSAPGVGATFWFTLPIGLPKRGRNTAFENLPQ